jgi:hypothetical protein
VTLANPRTGELATPDTSVEDFRADGLLARLGRLDKNAEKAQQEVAA